MDKYWFGFKVKDGRAIAIGPFPYERVNAERQRAKARDAEVSPWFVADNEEQATAKAEFHLK